MRRVALALLLAMAAVFGAAFYFEPHYPFLSWVKAGAEAGLVGGLADWFAVVALFRHPLGLPFPHTAIIPRNKDRIGEALGSFIENRFLTPENVRARLDTISITDRSLRWLGTGSHAAELAASVLGLVPQLLASIDDAEIESLIGRFLRTRLDRLDGATLSGGLLRFMAEDGRLQPILEQLLDALAAWLDENRETILERYGTRSRWTPRWADSYIVNRFVDAVLDLTAEVVRAPRHDLRVSFDSAITTLADRLEHDPELRAQSARIQKEAIELLQLDRQASAAWADIKQRLLDAPGGALEIRIGTMIKRAVRSLRRDRALVARIERAALAVIDAVLSRARPQVSALIRDVVKRWDAREATRNLELEVGRDLQFIRLNGTLVGAAVGLALHALVMLAAMAR